MGTVPEVEAYVKIVPSVNLWFGIVIASVVILISVELDTVFEMDEIVEEDAQLKVVEDELKKQTVTIPGVGPVPDVTIPLYETAMKIINKQSPTPQDKKSQEFYDKLPGIGWLSNNYEDSTKVRYSIARPSLDIRGELDLAFDIFNNDNINVTNFSNGGTASINSLAKYSNYNELVDEDNSEDEYDDNINKDKTKELWHKLKQLEQNLHIVKTSTTWKNIMEV